MRTRVQLLLLVGALVCLTPLLPATAQTWPAGGAAPADKTIEYLWVGTTFANANSGVWRYDFTSASWQRRSNGLPADDLYIQDLDIDPYNPNVLLAVVGRYAENRRVYRTQNAGASWQLVNMPEFGDVSSTPKWHCLHWDPATPDKVLAVGMDFPYQESIEKSGRLPRVDRAPRAAISINGGLDWSPIYLPAYASAWPINGGAIWGSGNHWYIIPVGTSDVDDHSPLVWNTVNGGQTWRLYSGKDLPTFATTNTKQPLVGRPEDPTFIYQAREYSSSYGWVFRSQNLGHAWTTIMPREQDDHLAFKAGDMAYDPSHSDVLWLANYANDDYENGVWRLRDDGGATVHPENVLPASVHRLAINGVSGRVYATDHTPRIIWYSDDSGQNWDEIQPRLGGREDIGSINVMVSQQRPLTQ